MHVGGEQITNYIVIPNARSTLARTRIKLRVSKVKTGKRVLRAYFIGGVRAIGVRLSSGVERVQRARAANADI